jgi:uncharacterized protein (DUF433 family)
MSRIDWKDHIEIAPDLHHGDACIAGTRIPVAIIIGSLADGMTAEEIMTAYPQLELADIQASLAYASEIMRLDVFLPFAG